MSIFAILTRNIFTLLAACCMASLVSAQPTARPNIIFIMNDDHAYQAISAYGSKLVETPNIDRLAEEGMRFDRAYVTNSICSPSRAVVLTGKFSHLNSVKDNIDVFDSSQVTLPKILQENGYQTAIVGKWHLKSAPTGFDYWKVLIDQGYYYHPEFRTPDGIVKEYGYATDVVTDLAIEYLDSIRDRDEPFMLMYQHKAPHREWWPPIDSLTTLIKQRYPEPPTLFDNYEGRGAAAREAEMRIGDHMGLTADNKLHPDTVRKHGYVKFLEWYDEVYFDNYNRLTEDEKQVWDEVFEPVNREFDNNPRSGHNLTSWKYQRYMQDYLACIESVDQNLGRLLEYLDSSGLSENTVIIYTSDQGFYLGEHGWFDKRFIYEESFRTPLIVKWPNAIIEGSINSNLVQNIDFAPTILDVAGVAVPGDMQGLSIVPLLKHDIVNWRDALYYHYYEFPSIHMVKRHYGIRTNRYKLIHFYYDVDEWELYDLRADPFEMQNVYNDPEYNSIKEDLHNRLEELRKQYGDSDELARQMLDADLERLGNK